MPDEIAASAGHAVSVQTRKLIEQGLGWAKTIGSIRQVMQRGLKRVNQIFYVNDGGEQLNTDEKPGSAASTNTVTVPRDVKRIKQARPWQKSPIAITKTQTSANAFAAAQ